MPGLLGEDDAMLEVIIGDDEGINVAVEIGDVHFALVTGHVRNWSAMPAMPFSPV